MNTSQTMLRLIQDDPWLQPFSGAIGGRHDAVVRKEEELTRNGALSLSEFSSGYLYFGLPHLSGEDVRPFVLHNAPTPGRYPLAAAARPFDEQLV